MAAAAASGGRRGRRRPGVGGARAEPGVGGALGEGGGRRGVGGALGEGGAGIAGARGSYHARARATLHEARRRARGGAADHCVVAFWGDRISRPVGVKNSHRRV